MRSDAFRAAWRNTFRCATELVFSLFLHWRTDPMAQAVALPLVYLRGVVRRGFRTRQALEQLWSDCTSTLVGPVAAAKQSFALAGLVGSPGHCVAPDGCTLDLLSAPEAEVRTFALASFHAQEMTRLAARRPPFASLALSLIHI